MAAKQRELQRAVTFHDEDGDVTFGPGDELPAERAKHLDDEAKTAGLKQHPAFGDVADES